MEWVFWKIILILLQENGNFVMKKYVLYDTMRNFSRKKTWQKKGERPINFGNKYIEVDNLTTIFQTKL